MISRRNISTQKSEKTKGLSLLCYVHMLTIISTLNFKVLEIPRPDYAMSGTYKMCLDMALLHRLMFLPVHQIGVAKQPGKRLQLVDPSLQRKTNKQNPKSVNRCCIKFLV